jgi:hypothetical protein
VAVVGIAGQRLGMGDELTALGAMQRRGEGPLDAELIRAMGFSLADAFDLGRIGVEQTDILTGRHFQRFISRRRDARIFEQVCDFYTLIQGLIVVQDFDNIGVLRTVVDNA